MNAGKERFGAGACLPGPAPLALLLVLLAAAACGQDSMSKPQGLVGWEQGGEYDQRYDPRELDRVKGFFQESIEIQPLKGMAPGLGVIMRDRADDELVVVHLGPKEFVERDLERFGLVTGQKMSATGVWAEFDGQDVLMASKIKQGEFQQIKVRRTSDGTPYWSMSLEQLASERQAEFEDDGS